MKKLVVYDESCPMCRLYTKGMVLADPDLVRVGNGQLTNTVLLNQLDRQRARHELPLIDLDGGETLYGVDTWAYAFGRKSQLTSKLLSAGWLRAILQKLYAFVSVNRRIIITSAPGRWQLLDLQPDFRASYRLTFVLIVFGLVGALFTTVSGSIVPIVTLLVGQLLLVCLFSGFTRSGPFLETILDYAGHLGMSLLVGGLVVGLGRAVGWPTVSAVGYALAIGQHFIRVYCLGLNPWLSVGYTGLLLVTLHPL